MFWVCFNLKEAGQLIAIRGVMKFEEYIKILEENLLLSVQNLDIDQGFTLQQDNNPKSTSKSVCELQKKKTTVLLWPSMSADLNLLENLWQELKVRINCQSSCNL